MQLILFKIIKYFNLILLWILEYDYFFLYNESINLPFFLKNAKFINNFFNIN